MADRLEGPEIPSFSPESFGARVFEMKDAPDKLNEFLMYHLDPVSGADNLAKIQSYFLPLTKVNLRVEPTSKAALLLEEISLWDPLPTDPKMSSEEYGAHIKKNWDTLVNIISTKGDEAIRPGILAVLRTISTYLPFSKERYAALFESSSPEPPEAPVPVMDPLEAPDPATLLATQSESAPEPGLPEFSKQVSEVMNAGSTDRASRLTQLLSKWPADRVSEISSPLESKGNAGFLKAMREVRNEKRQKAMLALAGFDSKPSGRDYFIQVNYLLSLLEQPQAPEQEASREALRSGLMASLMIVAPTIPADDAEVTAMLKNPSSLSDVQFERVFRIKDEIPEGLDETSVNANDLTAKVNKAMSVEPLRRPREMKKVLGELSLDQLKVALGPLLATTMEKAEFHRNHIPRDKTVQKAILALSGFSSAPAARTMFGRLGHLKEILDGLPDPSGADTPVGIYKRAIELALMHIAPPDILAKLKVEVPEEAAPDPSDVTSWGARFRARAKKAVKGIKDTTVGNAVQTQLLNNSIRRTNGVTQYNDFFGRVGESTRPTPPSPPAPPRPDGADPAPDSEREEDAPRAGLLARASDGVDKVFGKGNVPSWVKVAGLAYFTVAGTEWVVRSGKTAVKTTWNVGVAGLRTALNVVSSPFSGMLEKGQMMWEKGWNAIEPAEPPSIPDETKWYERVGKTAWYRTRQLGRVAAAATLGSTLAFGGAAYGGVEGTGKMALEAAGIRYEPSLNVGVTVQEVVAAIKGKVGEEALQEIAAMTDLPEAIQKAIAELGEGGLEILEKAGVIADSKAKSFGDRFHVVKGSGAIAMARELAGGAKEAVIDNTVQSAKVSGVRHMASWVLGDGIKDLSLTDAQQLATAWTGIRDTFEENEADLDPTFKGINRKWEAFLRVDPDKAAGLVNSAVDILNLERAAGPLGIAAQVAPFIVGGMARSRQKEKSRYGGKTYDLTKMGANILGMRKEELKYWVGNRFDIAEVLNASETLYAEAIDRRKYEPSSVTPSDSDKIVVNTSRASLRGEVNTFLGFPKKMKLAKTDVAGRVQSIRTTLADIEDGPFKILVNRACTNIENNYEIIYSDVL